MEKHKNPTTGEPLETHNDPDHNRVNQNREYPGYPHYPARDDVMKPGNEQVMPDELLSEENDPDENELASILDPNADVTDEDLALLGDPDRDPDGLDDEEVENYEGLDDTDFDGEPLNERAGSLVADGDDLDMPDEELENSGTAMEPDADEENDYYSLGAEKDSLEDDQSGENF